MRAVILILCLVWGAASDANIGTYKLEEVSGLTSIDSETLFQKYCGPIPQKSTKIPEPVYENPLVRAAAYNLDKIAPVSFYMYSTIVKSYGFRKKKDNTFPWEIYEDVLDDPQNESFGEKVIDWETMEKEFSLEELKLNFAYRWVSKSHPTPQGVKDNTHAYLTYLCGEFRDRPTLIEEKLKWLKHTNKLPVADQQPVQPSKSIKNIWSLITAESYAWFILFSSEAFNAKKQEVWKKGRYLRLSEKWEVDRPVPGFTVCEIKYIFTEYITRSTHEERKFPGNEKYQRGLSQYQQDYCSQEDLDYYYDFRGDSNLKPNSPESNAMIWHSTSILNRCRRSDTGEVYVASTKKDGQWMTLDFPQSECEAYMESPFQSRWNAARAALATWLFQQESFFSTFDIPSTPFSILPHLEANKYPFGFVINKQKYSGFNLDNFIPSFEEGFQKFWPRPDMGFNGIFLVDGTSTGDIDGAYNRLKAAVDRHTSWYSSGYDDSGFEPERARVTDKAYSPFVASSYEMSESDAFVAPGLTVNGPRDRRRHWMFIFKVHKDKWYTPEDLLNGKPLDFDHYWFDETSFGTTSLADREKAWDRLGSTLEGEMEAILYLHNIKSGQPIKHAASPDHFPLIKDDGFGKTNHNHEE